LLAALDTLDRPPDLVVIDGYVWLDRHEGLGAHLYEALERRVPVIGVAKAAAPPSPAAQVVLRGRSRRPLYVTSAGLPVEVAAAKVRSMAGPHRIPTLLGEADRLARAAARGFC
jgi:deoxyribonuclease V